MTAGEHGGLVFLGSLLGSAGGALRPQLPPLTFKPAGAAALCEASGLLAAAGPSSRGRPEDRFGQDEELAPCTERVKSSNLGEGASQALRPGPPSCLGHMAQHGDVGTENGG